jgi:HD-GYP domain-containing protein (c-di-GMP phosphodiesterase class II)
VYSTSVSIASALEELRACAGTQFDPGVALAFCDMLSGRVDPVAKGA